MKTVYSYKVQGAEDCYVKMFWIYYSKDNNVTSHEQYFKYDSSGNKDYDIEGNSNAKDIKTGNFMPFEATLVRMFPKVWEV